MSQLSDFRAPRTRRVTQRTDQKKSKPGLVALLGRLFVRRSFCVHVSFVGLLCLFVSRLSLSSPHSNSLLGANQSIAKTMLKNQAESLDLGQPPSSNAKPLLFQTQNSEGLDNNSADSRAVDNQIRGEFSSKNKVLSKF